MVPPVCAGAVWDAAGGEVAGDVGCWALEAGAVGGAGAGDCARPKDPARTRETARAGIRLRAVIRRQFCTAFGCCGGVDPVGVPSGCGCCCMRDPEGGPPLPKRRSPGCRGSITTTLVARKLFPCAEPSARSISPLT